MKPFMTNVFLNAENKISDCFCFNRVKELKQKMWILLEFATKNVFFLILTIKLNSCKADPFKLNVILKQEIKYQMWLVASCFNRVIELNPKMLILSKFLTKNNFLCNHDNWIVYEILCNIKLCFLWRFDDKMSAIYWEIVSV
jgi:hypothetical protein